jgi:hypothetical protein
VYVVVATGVSCRLPRGVTRPGSGSIVTAVGFSVCHTRVTGCPALTEAGFTLKSTILAGRSLALA